jgi:hypothetical protein
MAQIRVIDGFPVNESLTLAVFELQCCSEQRTKLLCSRSDVIQPRDRGDSSHP